MPRICANGVSLEYAWHGDPRQPVVLGIVGFCDQLTAWPAPLVEAILASGRSMLVFDSRDMGLSTHFTEAGHPDPVAVLGRRATYHLPYTLADMADDAISLLNGLGIAKAHVMGYSMGGAVAQIATIRGTGLFLSATAIFSTSYAPGLPARDEAVRAKALRCCAHGLDKPGWIDAMAALMQAVEGRAHGFGASRRGLARASADRAFDPAGIARHVLAIAEYGKAPLLAELSRLALPFLVLQSDDDPLFNPRHGDDLHARVPGARLQRIEGAGHALCDSVAPILADAIINHLNRAEGKAP